MAEVSDVLGDFTPDALRSGFQDIAVWVIWGLLIIGVLVFIWLKYQDKKIYIYPVRIFRQRRNGMVKEQNTFGGYIKKAGITQFIIKVGKFKKKNMDKIPLSEHMDEDNRVYYWQLSPESPLVQTKREFRLERIFVPNEEFIEPSLDQIEYKITKKIEELKTESNYKDTNDEILRDIATDIVKEELNEERNKLTDITIPVYTPIPTDLKQQAMMDISTYKQVLGVDVNKQFAYFIMGVIALVILGTIIFYIAINKGDIPILTEFIPLLFFRRKSKKK